MNEQTLQNWGTLHRRSVLGLPLSAEELAAYEAGCQELDAEEILQRDPFPQALESRLNAVLETQHRLQEQEEALSTRIAALETRLDEWTHQPRRGGN